MTDRRTEFTQKDRMTVRRTELHSEGQNDRQKDDRQGQIYVGVIQTCNFGSCTDRQNDRSNAIRLQHQ
ncbi:hypothetical protein DPMN_010805 [Dreissena polymorpha]|uniref:Uncharacterized protein n=1 Tax=Dreissena polymorpha TaxID=45954 RepID=A0A9D4MZD7_DREPO|nr:hypothetical protein DPMN_010805 [Dreissena polymorpha]